jgi:hypothetical protein
VDSEVEGQVGLQMINFTPSLMKMSVFQTLIGETQTHTYMWLYHIYRLPCILGKWAKWRHIFCRIIWHVRFCEFVSRFRFHVTFDTRRKTHCSVKVGFIFGIKVSKVFAFEVVVNDNMKLPTYALLSKSLVSRLKTSVYLPFINNLSTRAFSSVYSATTFYFRWH